MREVLLVILGCIGIAGWAIWLSFLVCGIYAMFKAAANRAPGCGRIEAMNSLSLLFNDDNFSELGRKWTKTHRRCMLGFLLASAGEFLIACLAWLLQP
jgi:hypothetical protein